MFDPTKPVQTRDGRKTRIICTDMNFISGKTIVALTERPETFYGKLLEGPCLYHPDGHFLDTKEDNPRDLVNVPEQVVRYVNVYDLDQKNHMRAAIGVTYVDPILGKVKNFDAVQLKLVYEDGKLIDSEIVR